MDALTAKYGEGSCQHSFVTLYTLQEKYGDGGYLKLWIPESSNAARLEELRKLIRKPDDMRPIFERLFDEETA